MTRLLALAALLTVAGCRADAPADAPAPSAPDVPPVPPTEVGALGALLPEAVAGLPRVSLESASETALGATVARAEARYGAPVTEDGPAVYVSVLDAGSPEMLAHMGYDATSDERLDGFPARRPQPGVLEVVVGGRFLVEAEAEGGAPASAAEEAVRAVGLARVAALAGAG